MHLVDELASRAADPAPVADEAAIAPLLKREWSYCLFCSGSLDTGFECNDCGADLHPLMRALRAAPRNDDGRLRKLREFVSEMLDHDRERLQQTSNDRFWEGSLAADEAVSHQIDRLLAESPAGDAGGLFNDDKLRSEIVAKWGPAGAHIDVFDDLRARLQAAEAELDEKAELLDKVIYDAEEFSGKLSDILDKNLVPDGEPLARVKEAIDMLTETILERDKLEAERDKLAADLAAAQKERDAIEQRETKGVALFDQIVAELRRDLAAAKAEGARAVVEELEGLAKVFEKNCADMRRNAMEQPTTALNGYDVQANVWMHACDAVSWRIAKLRAAQPQPTTAEPATTSDRTPKEGKQPIFWAPWRESGATVRQGDDRLSDRPACEEVVRTFNPVTATPSETWVYVQCRRALEGKP